MADVTTSYGIDPREALAGLDALGKEFDKLEKEAKAKADAIRKALALAISKGAEGTDEFQALTAALAEAEGEAERLGSAMAKASGNTEKAAVSADDLKRSMARLVQEGKKGSSEFASMADELRATMKASKETADAMAEVEAAAAAIGKELEGANTSGLDKIKNKAKEVKDGLGSGGIGGGLSSLVSGLPPQAAAAAAAIGVFAAVTSKAVGAAREFQEAQREVGLQTGLAGDALEGLADTARNAYIKGVGGSASEALKIVGQLRTTLGDSVPVDGLDEAAASASKVAKTLGVETPELVAKLSPVIKQYGLSFDQALNLVSGSVQNGVSDIGGYLDAIQEFTPNAREAGLSAEEFAGRLGNAAKLGAKDLAKVGDGYKELNNRIKSGDLATQVGAIGGAVGKQLQEIAKLAQEGTITADEAAQRSVALLDDAAKKGQITAKTQGQALTTLFGSIAEDLGTDVTSKIYGGKVDVANVKAQADKAGKAIKDQLAKQDPLEKLQRTADVFLEGFGGPILNAINVIGDLVNEIFGGIEDGGDGIQRFGAALGELVAHLGDNIRDILRFVLEVKKGVTGIADFIGDLFGGDSANDKVKEAAATAEAAAKAKKKAAEELTAEAANLAKTNGLNGEAVKALADKYHLSVEEATDLVAKSEAVGNAAKAAAVDINNLAQGFTNAQAAADSAVSTYSAGIAGLRLQIKEAERAGNKELVASLRATLEDSLKEQAENRKKARTLAVEADRADLVGNKARLAGLALADAQAALQRATDEKKRAAARIADVREQARENLRIDQEARAAALELQIKYADTSTVEARKALENLRKDRKALDATDQAERLALAGQFALEDVSLVIEAEKQKTDALIGEEQTRLEIVQRAIERRGAANEDLVRAEAAASERIAKLTAEQNARTYIEGLQEFQKAKAKIDAATAAGTITKDQAIAQIAGLYRSVGDRLKTDALTGGDALARGYLRIFQGLDRNLEDLQRNTGLRLARLAIESDTTLVRRTSRIALAEAELAYKERVKAANGNQALELAAWREFLGQRAEIERQYLTESSEAYRASVSFRQALEEQFTGLFGDEQEAQAEQARENYRKQLADLSAALESGQLTWAQYREKAAAIADESAQAQTSTLSKLTGAFLGAINKTIADALELRAQKLAASADRAVLVYRDNGAKIQALEAAATEAALQEIQARSEGRFEDAAQFMERYNDLTAEQTGLQREQADVLTGALEAVAGGAAASFGKMIVEGKSAWKALVSVALDALQSLVPILVAQIFGVQVASPNPANAFSFGSAGTIAALALTGVLQGLVGIAKSSLKLARGGVAIGENGRLVGLEPGPYGYGVDSIPAFLDWGESVVTRKGTRARGALGGNAELLEWFNQTGRPWEDFLVDSIGRGRLNKDLLLDRLGISFSAQDARGAGVAIMIDRTAANVSTKRLEALIEAQTVEIKALRSRVLQKVDVGVSLTPDSRGIFEAVEVQAERRANHIG